MRVMVIVKATRESEAGVLPEPELLAAMGRFNEELVNAGVMLAGEGMKASSNGARVVFRGAGREVVPGPFPETDQLVAGSWLWKVQSLDEAIAWVKKCPNPMDGESVLEVRPVFEVEDFGNGIPDEVKERETKLRERLRGQ